MCVRTKHHLLLLLGIHFSEVKRRLDAKRSVNYNKNKIIKCSHRKRCCGIIQQMNERVPQHYIYHVLKSCYEKKNNIYIQIGIRPVADV